MPSNTQSTLTDALRSTAHLLTDSARDYDPLFDLIGEARVVLLGEASHGTHDFYRRVCAALWSVVEHSRKSRVDPLHPGPALAADR